MSLTELLPLIRMLSKHEKTQLFDTLKAELAGTDSIAPLEHDKTYPIWTPYGDVGTARGLMKALEEAQQQDYK